MARLPAEPPAEPALPHSAYGASSPPPEPALQRPPPWVKEQGQHSVLQRWASTAARAECFVSRRTLASQPARTVPMPADLDRRLVAALTRRGIRHLYSHQRQAIDASLSGRHVAIATPTASGKSLCLHLPVLQSLAEDNSASALYLYPTKALSRDQEHGILSLIGEAQLGLPAVVYDGDTPADARRAARQQCRLLLTNPDMLHASILPSHTRWARVFQNLRYVVIDEVHTYRGVFGSHMAHVLSRLKRIARLHGANPRFITATATIGNPRAHIARLLGLPPPALELVQDSGAPQAERELRVYNPPVVNAELGVRASALKHAVHLAVDLVRAGVSTIVFAPSRNSVEVILKYLREQAEGVPRDSIFGYRGGYLPERRRAIERGLREGRIRCVVATNALELGIDIGELEAVVCMGFPGSVASMWQRFGRAGRRGRRSLAILVCSNHATDQFVAGHPDTVLDRSAEEARIDPDNVDILMQHLKCAAFESPFRLRNKEHTASRKTGELPLGSPEAQGTPEAQDGPTENALTSVPNPGESALEPYLGLDADTTRDALDYLAERGLVHCGAGQYTWIGETSPATHVSLRSISWDNFVVINVETDQVLAELDFRSAHTMVHEQAIYQHDAAQYQVERLDYDNHKAYVRPVAPDYFTTALTHSRVAILEVDRERQLPQGSFAHGDLQVVERITGYKKVKYRTHENTGYGEVNLPDLDMHTTGVWWRLPSSLLGVVRSRALLVEALQGAGRALETVACIALMCEPADLRRSLAEGDPEQPSEAGSNCEAAYLPTLFVFDAQPGGVGLARRIYERAEPLLAQAAQLIERCPCRAGCPACIGASVVASERKALAARLLSAEAMAGPGGL